MYVYLRIMRESTDLRCEASDKDIDYGPSDDLPWLSEPLCFLDKMESSTELLQDSTSTGAIDDMSACEFVYGIPFQLLVLMNKTSELIRRRRRFSKQFPGAAMSRILSDMCESLEAEILDWPIDRIIAEIADFPIPQESRDLMEHQTKAFHQAIIIYFSQQVRSVHRKHLQPYVHNIINHLEAVEIIKHRANLSTGCILWPGFIGAAEALDAKAQSRYLQWFRSTRFYGLGAYDKACEIVLAVWERQKPEKGHVPCDWSSVVESKDIRLMLT